jgi:Leucine-rich repeat (LRR) protein
LGKVWSAENDQFTITCSGKNLYCTFRNVFSNNSNIDEYSDDSMDFRLARWLKFKNSNFKRFPAPLCIPRNFVHLKNLLASDCGMSELGDTFVMDSTKSNIWNLTYIDFSRNRLSKIESLDRCPYLQYLDLSSNRIEELRNGSFAGLEQLQILNLGTNNISKIGPETFSTVINLKTVILADNKLIELPKNMFSTQSGLFGIDLAHNYLATFDFSTVQNTNDLKWIKLLHNNIQSLKNVTIWKQNKTITIDVTDNKWNCLYAQLLREIATRRKYKLIGNIFNCSINWLDSRNNKKLEEQNKYIANFGERLNTSLDKFDSEITKLNRAFEEQAAKINMIKMSIVKKNSEMLDIVINAKAEQKKVVEDYIKGKTNINPWIIIVILTATTILTAIAGAFAVLFVKNYRSQYRFDVVKDLMQE